MLFAESESLQGFPPEWRFLWHWPLAFLKGITAMLCVRSTPGRGLFSAPGGAALLSLFPAGSFVVRVPLVQVPDLLSQSQQQATVCASPTRGALAPCGIVDPRHPPASALAMLPTTRGGDTVGTVFAPLDQGLHPAFATVLPGSRACCTFPEQTPGKAEASSGMTCNSHDFR